MVAFIHIEIKNAKPIAYINPFLEHIKSVYPAIQRFDFDNFSDKLVVDCALQLVRESQKLVISINDEAAVSQFGLVTVFLSKVKKQADSNPLVITSHGNPVIGKIAKVLGKANYHNTSSPEKRKTIIASFLTNQWSA